MDEMNDTNERHEEVVEMGLLDSISHQFGSTPWWVISASVHAAILMLMTLVTWQVGRDKRGDVFEVHPYIIQRKKPEPPEYRNIFKPPAEFTRDKPEEEVTGVKFDVEEAEIFETDNNMETHTAKGAPEDILTEINDPEVGHFSFLGVGSKKQGSGSGFMGFRGEGGDKNRARRGGGGAETVPYLNAALEWLARHQERDGHWDAAKYGGQKTDVGVTGLALLAFLGDGHSQKFKTKYQDQVHRAVTWLISKQARDGCIGRGYERGLGYHHAIAGVALAEATAMNNNLVPKTRMAAQKAVDYSVNVHQKHYSGWRYGPKQDADTSVTGWFVMQLKSAHVAKLKVDGEAFQGAIKFIDEVTTRPGADGGYGGRVSYMPGRTATPTMTAVGTLCRLFMGWKNTDELVRGGTSYVLDNAPRWRNNSDVNFYYWYYGTLVMFQSSKEEWDIWNKSMKEALLTNQCRDGDDKGSWDPVGRWCSSGGRVYSTALGALCLEIYFRFNFGNVMRAAAK